MTFMILSSTCLGTSSDGELTTYFPGTAIQCNHFSSLENALTTSVKEDTPVDLWPLDCGAAEAESQGQGPWSNGFLLLLWPRPAAGVPGAAPQAQRMVMTVSSGSHWDSLGGAQSRALPQDGRPSRWVVAIRDQPPTLSGRQVLSLSPEPHGDSTAKLQ